jgi:hypothetical protein
MASVDEIAGGTLGELNTGLDQATVLLPALTAQIDAAIGLGLGPLKFDLGVQLNAALAATATLTLQVGNPLAALQAALAAVVQLQAAITASLALPPVQLSLGAELSAMAALAGTVSARLGAIEGIIQAALAAKLPAVQFLDGLDLNVGPAILLGFDGISDGTQMSQIGNLIQNKLQAPVTFGGDTIQPTDNVSGVLLLTTADPVFTVMAQIFAGL